MPIIRRAAALLALVVPLVLAGGSASAQAAPQPAAGARPMGAKLTVHARNGIPLAGTFRGRVAVPALRGTEHDPGPFVLESAGGMPALARVGRPRQWSADTAYRAYPVTLTQLRGGRTYTGKVRLDTTQASTVELTVQASDSIWFLLLTVLLGVGLGLLVRRWTDLHRPATVLRERVLRAGDAFGRAVDAPELGGERAKTLQAEFTAKQRDVYARLKELTRFLVSNDEVQKEFEAARRAVEALEAKVAAATALAAELKALRTTHTAVLPLLNGARPPAANRGVLPPVPRAVLAAETTLAQALALDEMETVRAAAAAQRALLPRWAKLFQEADQKQAWLDQLRRGRDDRDEARLAAAQQHLERVHWDLWDLADAAGFDARAPETALQEAEDELRQVSARRAAASRSRVTYRGGDEDEEALEATPTAEPGRVWLSVPGDGPLPATPAEQLTLAERIRVARGARDIVIAGAAFAAALLTTLSRHYFGGDPFGSFADYSAVFGWAFGITAATSLVLTNLTAGLATLQRAGLPPLANR
jgi:hypothetical protein